MRKMLTLSLGLVFLGGVSGCGASSAETALKESIASINELAEILEGIKDDASATAAIPRIEKAAARVAETAQKLKSQKMTQSEQKRVGEQYTKEMQKAFERLVMASIGAGTRAPGKALQVTDAMGKAFENLGAGALAMQGKPSIQPRAHDRGKRK